jgi:hypothetical protein
LNVDFMFAGFVRGIGDKVAVSRKVGMLAPGERKKLTGFLSPASGRSQRP